MSFLDNTSAIRGSLTTLQNLELTDAAQNKRFTDYLWHPELNITQEAAKRAAAKRQAAILNAVAVRQRVAQQRGLLKAAPARLAVLGSKSTATGMAHT